MPAFAKGNREGMHGPGWVRSKREVDGPPHKQALGDSYLPHLDNKTLIPGIERWRELHIVTLLWSHTAVLLSLLRRATRSLALP